MTTVQTETVTTPPVTAPVARTKISIWWALAAAVGAGAALLLSFPLPNVWWLAPIAVALLAIATRGRGFWGGFRLGGLAGLVFFIPLLSWTQIVGGPLAWMLLAVAEAAYIGLLGAASAIAAPVIERWRWTWPPAVAVLWVAQEALRDRTPFGGFPWGRLAGSQGDSPTLRYAVAGGAPFVTFMVALAGGLLALAAWTLIFRAPGSRRIAVTAVTAALGAVAVFLLGLAVPTSAPKGRPVQIAIVQGNVPRLGLEFNAQRRAVLDNHVRATLALAASVKAGKTPQPDLVIWPENSSDIDPLVADDPGNEDAADEISAAATAVGVPILVGAVLEGPGDHGRNAAIVWSPDSGPGAIYVKQHPVPFAEYVPLRSLARKVTKRVDLIRTDFVAGHRPGVLQMGSGSNAVIVGDAICFEVAYDDLVRSSVTGGAQMLTVQTNNADFNPAEARQQMAMVRLRAVEHGRDALMVSTVGISGFVDSSGGVHNETGFNVVSTQSRQLRLGDQRTLATELGESPEFAACALAIALLLAAVWLRRRATLAARATARSAATTGTATDSTVEEAR